MPQFAANLTLLFNEYPFLERFEAAAQAGFGAVEFQFPYAFDAQAIAAKAQEYALKIVLHNLPAGDWAAGDRGIACHPDRVNEFQEGVFRAIEYAHTLGVKQLNCLAGIAPEGLSVSTAHHTFVHNLHFAADKLEEAGIKLLIEPINRYDIAQFFLHRSAQALALLDELAHGNVYLQYDVYHAQRSEGELIATMKGALERIGHIQIADNPGRHEPGTGEINYRKLFSLLDEWGYPGYIGCEYLPANTQAGGTLQGLRWMAEHGVAPSLINP